MTLFVTYTGEETKSLSKSRHIEFSTRKPTRAEYMFMYYVDLFFGAKMQIMSIAK